MFSNAKWILRTTAWSVALLVVGCAHSKSGGEQEHYCGDTRMDPGEECDDGNVTNGDGCDELCQLEGCGDHCICSPEADITDLIASNDLYFGYAVLGADVSIPDCGERETAKEVYVSLTPDFDGDLVLSTVHPTTQVDTVIEVRGGSCDGTSLGCVDSATTDYGGRITVPVKAGQTYVAMVETSNDGSGVFALSLHRPGVCEGIGSVEEITADLVSGRKFVVSTVDSSASTRGRCSAPIDNNPEALLRFVPTRSGVMVATTAHPDTDFDALLYVRQGRPDGEPFCDSSEAELACANDSLPWGTAPVLRFEALAGRPYSLFVDGGSVEARGEATVVLGYEATSPVLQALQGCDHDSIRDDYGFFAEAGQHIDISANTVDATTAADLRMRIRNPDGSELHEADDDFPCRHPPPDFSCPEYGFTAGTSGLYCVELYVGVHESCNDHHLANYELTVTADDQSLDLILFRDQ